MEVIKKKLHFIKDNWNTYFYNNNYFKKHLSSREDCEISTNYFGDIMHYFFDTFEILDTKKHIREDNYSFTECISNSIMLLQTMYVHQDLMDEMLYIFKLKRSNSDDKIQIREMRNELIGHPISRHLADNKIKSTVFWGNQLSHTIIHYVKYIDGKILQGEDKIYRIEDLIDKHKKYLCNEFNRIINYQIKALFNYKVKLSQQLQRGQRLSIDYIKNIETYIDHVYEIIPNYTEESLIFALKKYRINKRYKYYIDNFLAELDDLINDILVNIDEIISFDDNKKINKKQEYPKIDFIFCSEVDDKNRIITEEEKKKGMLSYYFEKLSQKKQLTCIDVMTKEYTNSKEILEELSLLKKASQISDIEYDISFIYLKFIVNKFWEKNGN